MKKIDLIKTAAQKAGITQKQAQECIEAALDTIKEAVVVNNDRITLPSFGTFSSAERSARTGHNPATGEKIELPACKVVKFKSSKDAWF